MVLALVAVTLAASIGLAFLGMSAGNSKRLHADVDAQRALYLAEAGLAEAFQGVRIGRTGTIGTPAKPATFGDGLVWVTAVETEDDQIRLDSYAMIGSSNAALSLVVEPIKHALGFFSDQDLVVESVLMVDGFNSEERPYLDELSAYLESTGQTEPPPEPHPAYADAMTYCLAFIELYGEELLRRIVDPVEDVTFTTFLLWDKYPYEYLDDAGVLIEGEMPKSEYNAMLDILPILYEVFPSGWGAAGVLDPSQQLLADLGGAFAFLSSPDSMHTGSGGLLASNGDILLDGLASDVISIWGDVLPGPEGEVVGSPSLSASGSIEPRPTEIEMPEVEIPVVTMQSGVTHSGLLPLVVPPGLSGYESLSVADGAELIVSGPAKLVVGTLELAAGAVLTLDTAAGPVELFITGGMDLAEGSIVETSNLTPEDLSIQVASLPQTGDPNVLLAGQAQFHGVVYAPDADVRVGRDFEVFGSIAARRLEIAPGARLHFDNAEYEGSPIPDIISWRILERPGIDPTRGADPFEALGLERASLVGLDAAHDLAEVLLMIEYVDRFGTTQSYVGQESDFDWSKVESVVSVDREPERQREAAPDPAPEALAPEETPGGPWDYAAWWEDPSILDPTIRRGVGVMLLFPGFAGAAKVTQGLIDLSPLTAAELAKLSSVISDLPPDKYAQVMAAQ